MMFIEVRYPMERYWNGQDEEICNALTLAAVPFGVTQADSSDTNFEMRDITFTPPHGQEFQLTEALAAAIKPYGGEANLHGKSVSHNA